jgi:hypothetical protein
MARKKSDPPAKPELPSHVAVELRLTSGEADLIRYWLARLAFLVERGVVTPAKGMDPAESEAAIRKLLDRVPSPTA